METYQELRKQLQDIIMKYTVPNIHAVLSELDKEIIIDISKKIENILQN